MSNESKKRGRPCVDDSRKKQYRIRLTDDEYADLECVSKLTGKSKSEIIREGIGYVKSISSVQFDKNDEEDLAYEDFYDEFDEDFDEETE